MSKAKVNQLTYLSEWKGVLVVAEQRYGKVLDVSYELLGEAKALATKIGCKVSVIVLGHNIDDEVTKLSHYGADKVVYANHELLENYTTDAYTKVISEYILANKPESVLVGATAIGRDLAPRIAGRVGTCKCKIGHCCLYKPVNVTRSWTGLHCRVIADVLPPTHSAFMGCLCLEITKHSNIFGVGSKVAVLHHTMREGHRPLYHGLVTSDRVRQTSVSIRNLR